jgi:hypothetical protein
MLKKIDILWQISHMGLPGTLGACANLTVPAICHQAGEGHDKVVPKASGI